MSHWRLKSMLYNEFDCSTFSWIGILVHFDKHVILIQLCCYRFIAVSIIIPFIFTWIIQWLLKFYLITIDSWTIFFQNYWIALNNINIERFIMFSKLIQNFPFFFSILGCIKTFKQSATKMNGIKRKYKTEHLQAKWKHATKMKSVFKTLNKYFK